MVSITAMMAPWSSLAEGRGETLRGFERPSHVTFPRLAPYSPQVAALGKMLFFDPRLSGAQNMSCATCHNPSFGWETPVARAIGALNVALERHAPTVENLAEASDFLWDGRAPSLERQAMLPITHPQEMGSTLEEVVTRLAALQGYRRAFAVAFPETGLVGDNVLRALATYQRTLRSGQSPFDTWVEGDETAVSESAKRGFDLFVGQALCATCHSGWAFTDHRFHDIGLLTDDIGRQAPPVQQDPHRRAFKTPGLRNIALRAPYMHHGEIATLADVIEHYNIGGHPQAGRINEIVPLGLTRPQISELVDFLQTLTAEDPHISQPALPAQ